MMRAGFHGIWVWCSLFLVLSCSSEKNQGGDRLSVDSGSPEDTGLADDARDSKFLATGAPITAPNRTWTWVDFPDAHCRDGSTAGIAVSLNGASDALMIFLEGGNACWDPITCGITPANIDKTGVEKRQGLFDRDNPKNPVKDWNFVFVPYCTGDLHAGTNPEGTVPDVDGVQAFVGRPNLEAYLNRIVPTFPNIDQVLLTGRSAGAFGALMNMDLVARAFAGTRVTVLDDSAPVLPEAYAPPCFLGRLGRLWGLEGSLLKDCGDACPNKDLYAMDGLRFLLQKYPGSEMGLIESNADDQVTLFYGYGKDDCAGDLSTPLSASEFDTALHELREEMSPFPNFHTYFPASTQHTWIADAPPGVMATSLYDEVQDGVPLIDWVTDIINNDPVADVGE